MCRNQDYDIQTPYFGWKERTSVEDTLEGGNPTEGGSLPVQTRPVDSPAGGSRVARSLGLQMELKEFGIQQVEVHLEEKSDNYC